jgi:hypothetical protein
MKSPVVTRSYYGAPTQTSPRARVVHRTIKSRQVSGRSHGHAVEPRMKNSYHQAKRAVARAKKLAGRERPLAGTLGRPRKPAPEEMVSWLVVDPK